MEKLMIKVCGMRDPQNIAEVAETGVDILGFIFYEKSKRYVDSIDLIHFNSLVNKPKKAGVFVNATEQDVSARIADFQLDYIQLHGDESPEYCAAIKTLNADIKLIKVFSVGETFDFKITEKYLGCADLFLFDTKGKERGGNGVKFNWDILLKYQGIIPFILSGGIGLGDVEAIRNFKHSKLWGLDVNSGFEYRPAHKNVAEIEKFIRLLEVVPS